jgi:predicted methyltransferase
MRQAARTSLVVMRGRSVVAGAVLLACVGASALADDASSKLDGLVAGPQRSEQNRVRDPYRHPRETLAFFGLRDDMTVVEIWPGGSGWWTEILAPYLADHGRLYEALPNPAASDEARNGNAAFAAKTAAAPAIYGKVIVTTLETGNEEIAPAGTADLVLTFRNLHDWVPRGTVTAELRAMYRALKPGGILGIEDHRAAADQPQDPQAKSGYLREDFTIALVESAGFRFVAKSEVNANPKDTKDYSAGVWTLPPTLRLKDQDRDKYVAIGESDRYTMKFVKPGP